MEGLRNVELVPLLLKRPYHDQKRNLINDSNIEELWLMRAIDHSVIHFNILCSIAPAHQRLSSQDDVVCDKFREKFSNLQVDFISDDILKHDSAKGEWRGFCDGFKEIIEDIFATLLRLDSSGEYTEENTIFVPCIQFLAIEVARNREGWNHMVPPPQLCETRNMSEVVDQNFLQILPNILGDIERSAFVAFDAEFTGILHRECLKPSLFDTPEERYRKMSASMENFAICQLGLAVFIPEGCCFHVSVYNCYICPKAFGSVDRRFSLQASSLRFLRRHNFDFNKSRFQDIEAEEDKVTPFTNTFIFSDGKIELVEEKLQLEIIGLKCISVLKSRGVGCLNSREEKALRKMLAEHRGMESVEHFSMIEEQDTVEVICSSVAEWVIQAKVGEEFPVQECFPSDPTSRYILHSEIRYRFPDVWTIIRDHQDFTLDGLLLLGSTPELSHVGLMMRDEKKLDDSADLSKILEPQRFVVQKVGKEWRQESKGNEKSNAEEELIAAMRGFSVVLDALATSKKPVVAHNLFLDLLLVYHQFHDPLP
ncbi:unnamed protein product, partial [Darwinula stevensoni]